MESIKQFFLLLWNALFAAPKFNVKPEVVAPAALPLPASAVEGPTAADFDVALKYVLVNEGGYSKDPNDKGGTTNKGITAKDVARYRNVASVSDAEMKALSDTEVAAIYKKYYWVPLNLDKFVDQNTATAVMDMGVLCGTGTAAGWAQEVCGVKSDRAIGPVSLSAINSMEHTEFIPKFKLKADAHFNAIVAKDATQKKFLNGWLNRSKKLLTLATPDELPATVPTTAPGETIGEGLPGLVKAYGLPSAEMERMIALQKKTKPSSNPRYWAMFDIGQHSKNKRMAIIDRVKMTVDFVHAAHGKNSDPDNNGAATVFSNVNGSNCSALGICRTAETYNMAGHGRALRLDGLEASNSNVRERGIVFHGSKYVGEDYVKANGKCGRSLGCPAIDDGLVQPYIDQLKGGSLLSIYKS